MFSSSNQHIPLKVKSKHYFESLTYCDTVSNNNYGNFIFIFYNYKKCVASFLF